MQGVELYFFFEDHKFVLAGNKIIKREWTPIQSELASLASAIVH